MFTNQLMTPEQRRNFDEVFDRVKNELEIDLFAKANQLAQRAELAEQRAEAAEKRAEAAEQLAAELQRSLDAVPERQHEDLELATTLLSE